MNLAIYNNDLFANYINAIVGQTLGSNQPRFSFIGFKAYSMEWSPCLILLMRPRTCD